MYDKGKIIPGLIIFLGLFTFPLWYNAGNAGNPPKPEKPAGYQKCVRPVEYMRTSHMVLLNQWRDEVIRGDEREMIMIDGKPYPKKLQAGCMGCHADKKKFCDRCHTYASVKPYCWDCHFPPKEKM
ncbi:MAG: sulfate reduction electron transfer complex DsrMKJOP subunit DsrJ [Desulfobacteraceae bacterium]|nr:sulfate reduction electron transfer complex DsrMKJOP subunit DsrJ [Desulfobacteraceae bacterium]